MDSFSLKKFVRKRFDDQLPVLSLWQELAENFYPERAHFTRTHYIGEELADNLASSQPLLIRRELANSFEAMLRDGDWFEITVEGDEPDHQGKMWLEWASKRLLMLINHRPANFRRATKEADHDYATFGNAVISVEPNHLANGLLFRDWHLKDCTWWDDENGEVDGVARRQEMPLFQMARYFGTDAMHPSQLKMLKEDPFKTCEVFHMDVTSAMYGDSKFGNFPRVSCWLDVKNDHYIQARGSLRRIYAVPRFQTIAGSPFAYSPATVVGLPDARTLQAMTHTLLEAGERHARPPIIATENVIRGDANLYPDGVTMVSEDYDERLGASLRPLQQDSKGFPFGLEMQQNIIEVLQSAFYVNKINLPETTHEMTAYEVQERMKQFRRENLPLFAPIEHSYSGALCEMAFDIAFNSGFLGSPHDVPESLKGRDVVFRFQSPLSLADQEKKANQFRQVAELLREAAEFDQGAPQNVDFNEALREAVQGTGAPEKWLRDLDDVKRGQEQLMQMQQAQAEAEAAA